MSRPSPETLAFVQSFLDSIEVPGMPVEEIERDLPEGWVAAKTKTIEMRDFSDAKDVVHVIGILCARTCGCTITIGNRLDRHEMTFGLFACGDEHEQTCMLVLDALQTMEPQDEPMIALAARMLEDNL